MAQKKLVVVARQEHAGKESLLRRLTKASCSDRGAMKETGSEDAGSIWEGVPYIPHQVEMADQEPQWVPAPFSFRSGSDELIIRNRRIINPN